MTFISSWGLPCPHIVLQLILRGRPLQVKDFDIYWRLERYANPADPIDVIILDPERLPQNRHAPGNGARMLSEFERVDH